MGKGGDGSTAGAVTGPATKTAVYSWDQIREHVKDTKWIVIDGHIYDITRWQKRHPGGARLISHFAGQDATEVWYAMHNNKKMVSKYMKSLLVGVVEGEQEDKKSILNDFRDLRQTAEDAGWFKVNPLFFLGHLGHIIALEILAFLIIAYYGTDWTPYTIAAALIVIAQAQAGWTQHDYGHHSVFNTTLFNHIAHHFVIGFIKGGSSHWWNFRHFQHHSKPNVIKKDPDIVFDHVLVIGDVIPVLWGRKKRGKTPFNYQQHYFWFLAPLLLPVYFNFEMSYFIFKRKAWWDLLSFGSFFVRWLCMYAPFFGVMGALKFYFFMRVFDSLWFVFVTQMNHIPMKVEYDEDLDWVSAQTIATCNVEPSPFNDWFTGHLNYQIEHHLFPTMPRHNYHKVAPLVKSLLKKYDLEYVEKPLSTAIWDIIRSLRKSGELWYDAYYHQ